jgi:hypothetical protein
MISAITTFFKDYLDIVVAKFKAVGLFHINGLEKFVNDHGFFAVAMA